MTCLNRGVVDLQRHHCHLYYRINLFLCSCGACVVVFVWVCACLCGCGACVVLFVWMWCLCDVVCVDVCLCGVVCVNVWCCLCRCHNRRGLKLMQSKLE